MNVYRGIFKYIILCKLCGRGKEEDDARWETVERRRIFILEIWLSPAKRTISVNDIYIDYLQKGVNTARNCDRQQPPCFSLHPINRDIPGDLLVS